MQARSGAGRAVLRAGIAGGQRGRGNLCVA